MIVVIWRALIDGNGTEAVSATDGVTITATTPVVNVFVAPLRRMRQRPVSPWSGRAEGLVAVADCEAVSHRVKRQVGRGLRPVVHLDMAGRSRGRPCGSGLFDKRAS